ncbi:NDUFA12-domain-containing protein [Meredithblackwellia eburnea MCA 4105]
MPYATPSILRVVENFRQVGFRGFWRQLQYIGDTKAGTFVGEDQHGNKYYQNLNETIWRHRWVDYSSHDFNASQVPPEWHAWLTHIRQDVPTADPIMIQSHQPWQRAHFENITGTRGAFKTYSTTKPKVTEWESKVAPRA